MRRFARRISSQIKIAELLVVARSQEESMVSRFEADVLSVIAETLTQAGTRAGTGDAYKRRMVLSIRNMS